MKNILSLFAFLLFISGGFAQEKSASIESLIQLVEEQDQSNIYEELLNNNLKNATYGEKEEFRNKIKSLISSHKTDTKVYLSKKFTQKELDFIFNEFTKQGLMNYDPRSISFIKEWRNKRKELQKNYDVIYNSYN